MATKPRIAITDKRFRYRPSHATDVRETFRAARRRAGLAASAERKADEQPRAPVVQMRKRAAGSGS